MTPLNCPVEGFIKYDPSSGRMQLELTTSKWNNQEIFTLPSLKPKEKELQEAFFLRQLTFIQTPTLQFFSSVLGVVGGVSFIVSCISSVLLPAIGSIGIIGIACLVKRTLVPLHVKELSSETAKAREIFKKKRESDIKPGQLPLQLSLNPAKFETDREDTTNNKISNPPAPPLFQEFPASPVTLQESSRSSSNIGKKQDPRKDFLSLINKGAISLKFNIKNGERTLRENPEIYSSNLLLKELKSTYERALGISESEKSDRWKAYFTDKLENFEKNFKVKKEAENPMIEDPDREDICKKAYTLTSLLQNMQWIKSLLSVLSDRKDLSKELQKYCSEKLNSIDKHVEELENCNKKQLRHDDVKEGSGINSSILKVLSDAMASRRDAVLDASDSESDSAVDTQGEDWE